MFLYLQVDNHTTKIAYMTAAMTSLANTHGITLSFMKSLGGKEALLREFPTIKQQVSGSLLTVENVECPQKYFSEFAGER